MTDHATDDTSSPSPVQDPTLIGAHVRPLVGGAAAHPTRVGLSLALLLATLATTTWAGALHQGVNLLEEPGRWLMGFPYALALLGILGIHEMGHYLVARRRGVAVTLPYFIPAPFYLGTFGAFIQMRGEVRDRTTYFDIAVAGPLAGLVAALLALAVGLPAGQGAAVHGGVVPASSALFAWVYALVVGGPLNQPVQVGALAFAGWIGLIVTALNLIPVGQLDGGHITYALLGRRRAATLGKALLVLLVAAGVLYSRHWLMWALLIWLFAGPAHPPARDEATPIGPGRRLLAGLTLVLLVAIIAPWPWG